MGDGGRDSEFSAFYGRYYGLILATAQRRVSGLAVAEDVTSEVFRVAWQSCLAGGELSLPWLYGVARNVIGNEYRRVSRSTSLYERLRDNELTVAREGDRDSALDILRGMDELREKDREVLELVYWDDLSGEEVAAVLGISQSAARVRLLRAREALKRVLARKEVLSDG